MRIAASTSLAAPSATIAPSLTPTAAAPTLPAGDWTSVHWTKVAVEASVWIVPPDSSDSDSPVDSGWTVYGWSRGYVAFDTITTADSDSWTQVTTSQNSTDGIHWQAGGQFTRSGQAGDDREFDAPDGVLDLEEAPAGLLAVGIGDPARCGGTEWEFPMATSVDGISWLAAPITDAGEQMVTVAGGNSGFVATAPNAIFTSVDGRSWKSVDLTAPSFKGLLTVNGGASFAGGFVVSGEANTPDWNCSGPPEFVTPALWKSADGTTWTRSKLPTTAKKPSGDTDLFVCQMGQRALILDEYSFSHEATESAWISTDGQDWRPLPVGPVVCSDGGNELVTSGGRSIVAVDPTDGSASALYTLGSGATLVKLAQTGDLPPESSYVFGPAGLITADGDGNTYVGVPVAG